MGQVTFGTTLGGKTFCHFVDNLVPPRPFLPPGSRINASKLLNNEYYLVRCVCCTKTVNENNQEKVAKKELN